MAYMRLMPYLCGRFFVTGNFSSEVSQHVTNIKRLINALQSFVSLVMSKGQTCPKRVQAVLKLLMSTAHQLQEEYGSLKKKAVIDDSNKKNTNLLNIIEDLSRDELISLLKQLSSSAVEEKNTPELRKCLDQKCTVNEMKKKLNELGLKMSSRGNAKKMTIRSHCSVIFSIEIYRRIVLVISRQKMAMSQTRRGILMDSCGRREHG